MFEFELDAETMNLLYNWHGGEGSATYSLLSIGEGSRKTIERAIDELDFAARQNDYANYLTWKLGVVIGIEN